MADIHDCALIATAGIAIDQEVTATLGPHMAQSHGCQLPNFGTRHASHFAPPFALRQQPAARGDSTICLYSRAVSEYGGPERFESSRGVAHRDVRRSPGSCEVGPLWRPAETWR